MAGELMATERACIACPGERMDELHPYRVEPDPVQAPFAGRTVVRCVECGLQQISAVPSADALRSYYEAGDYRSDGRHAGVDLDRFPFDSRWYLSRGRAVRRFVLDSGWSPPARPRVLDIGAGFGHVLYCIAERHPDADLFATEPGPECRPFLDRLGVTVLAYADDGLPLRDTLRFDLIVMTHVLEHLTSPVDAVRTCLGRLNPGGGLAIEVPNCTLEFQEHWEMTPHLSFFEPASLQRAIEQAGGRVQTVAVCGPEYPRATLRSRIPAPLKNLAKAVLGRTAAHRPDAPGPDLRDPDHLPDPSFVRYGPGRLWLRAYVTTRQPAAGQIRDGAVPLR